MKPSSQRNKPHNTAHAQLFKKPRKRRFAWGKVLALVLLIGSIIAGILVWQAWQMLQNTDPTQGSSTANEISPQSETWRPAAAPAPAQLSLTPDVNPAAEDIKADAENRRRQAAAAAARAASVPLTGEVPVEPMTEIVPTNVPREILPTNVSPAPANPQSQDIHPIPARPVDNDPIGHLLN